MRFIPENSEDEDATPSSDKDSQSTLRQIRRTISRSSWHAKAYAHLFLLENEALNQIRVQLRYYSANTRKVVTRLLFYPEWNLKVFSTPLATFISKPSNGVLIIFMPEIAQLGLNFHI